MKIEEFDFVLKRKNPNLPHSKPKILFPISITSEHLYKNTNPLIFNAHINSNYNRMVFLIALLELI
jgi:hypothetical protein